MIWEPVCSKPSVSPAKPRSKSGMEIKWIWTLTTPPLDLTSIDAQFDYCANPDAALAFTIFFGLSFCAHVLQAFTFRKPFCWVVIMAVLWQFGGFISRVFASKNQTVASSGAVANLLVMLAPLWLNAFVYMVFGRVVYYYLEEPKVLGFRAIHMARWFVWLDVT